MLAGTLLGTELFTESSTNIHHLLKIIDDHSHPSCEVQEALFEIYLRE